VIVSGSGAARALSEYGVQEPSDAVALAAADEKLQDLILRAREGSLPLSRPLETWEPRKLNEAHIQMIYLASCGVPQNRIAEITDYDESRVSVALNHPYSRLIAARISALAAVTVTDINARIKRMAPAALETIEDVLTDKTATAKVRAQTAFDLLAIGGYGENRQVDVNHKISVASDKADLLTRAIQESAQLPESQVLYIGPVRGEPGSGDLRHSADLAPADDVAASHGASQVSSRTIDPRLD
jgi:hypothetical protein